jgi:hypothetical protein
VSAQKRNTEEYGQLARQSIFLTFLQNKVIAQEGLLYALLKLSSLLHLLHQPSTQVIAGFMEIAMGIKRA